MAYSEFYCDAANGSNLNAGYPIGGSYPVTSTNGAYSRATGAGGTDQFIAASGTPFSGCAVEDCVSIFADAASAPTGFIGRVTAVNGGGASLDISLTAIYGTRPATAASGITAKVGGPFKGPNATSSFPSDLDKALANVAGDTLRVNFKNNADYVMTVGNVAIARSVAGPIIFQGYTTTPGDLGKAILRTPGTGTSANLCNVTGVLGVMFVDLIAKDNGDAGTGNGFSNTSASTTYIRCVATNIRGHGFNIASGRAIECEAYGCNTSNTANGVGFLVTTGVARRCISHDNTGSNSSGFSVAGGAIIDCVAETNTAKGILVSVNSSIVNCDLYNNGSDGIDLTNPSTSTIEIENCNFIKNGGYGIKGSGAGNRNGLIVNCGFGSGTQANNSGNTTGLKGIQAIGSITYAADVTPWNAPTTGDFTLALAAAKGTGRGSFTQTQTSYTGTLSYPNVGSSSPAIPLGTAGGIITSGGLTGIVG